jgi:hypothetical protein
MSVIVGSLAQGTGAFGQNTYQLEGAKRNNYEGTLSGNLYYLVEFSDVGGSTDKEYLKRKSIPTFNELRCSLDKLQSKAVAI